jgi:hypothetical protein
MPDPLRNSSETVRVLEREEDSDISCTIESLNCEWEEIVWYPDGTIESRRRVIRTNRNGVTISVGVVLAVGLLIGIMMKPDVVAPIAREVFRVLSRSG